jgi:CheY-like chemotaxis protein
MNQGVVLLAEDEPVVRQLVALTLQHENFLVLPTCDAEEALEAFRNHSNIDLLLTDVQMGTGMNGVDLAERILKDNSRIKAIVMSGFPDSELLAAQKNLPFLGKPFLPSVLINKVREVLGPENSAQSESRPAERRHDNFPNHFQTELVEDWRIRLQQAKSYYDGCSQQFRKVLADQNEGLLPAPDGSHAVRQARIHESAARQEYIRALRIFTDLIVGGKTPEQ